jgi:basic membrane lipoprotein Med (substrate-binding protein (PBP1-ABC) superfamily)
MHSAFERIDRNIAESRYAHIVIVGSMVPDGIEAIANGCQVTVLLYGGTGTVTENNVTTIGFESDTCRTDLAGIEI